MKGRNFLYVLWYEIVVSIHKFGIVIQHFLNGNFILSSFSRQLCPILSSPTMGSFMQNNTKHSSPVLCLITASSLSSKGAILNVTLIKYVIGKGEWICGEIIQVNNNHLENSIYTISPHNCGYTSWVNLWRKWWYIYQPIKSKHIRSHHLFHIVMASAECSQTRRVVSDTPNRWGNKRPCLPDLKCWRSWEDLAIWAIASIVFRWIDRAITGRTTRSG